MLQTPVRAAAFILALDGSTRIASSEGVYAEGTNAFDVYAKYIFLV